MIIAKPINGKLIFQVDLFNMESHFFFEKYLWPSTYLL